MIISKQEHIFIEEIIIHYLCGINNKLVRSAMRNFILILCVILFYSCASRKKEIIAKSTIKLEGRSTNIRKLINTDGYYTSSGSGGIIFFEDGTLVYFYVKDDISDSEISNNVYKSIRTWKESTQAAWWGANWGVYKIKDDTITVHSYDKPVFLKPLGISETRYKVINKETIKAVFFKIRTDDEYYKTNSPWIDNPPIHFVPADSLPNSNCWLKEEKWIWRNESDWKAYMEKIEVEKKKFRNTQILNSTQ